MTELVGSDGTFGAAEFGLFVIWEQARRDEREILEDLADRFRLIRAYEIRWTPALVRRNYERFYSDLEVRGVYHEINKGAGPFVAATLIDPHPAHDVRQTSRGPRTVNTNFFDAKLEYRDRVAHLGVHCSETAWETRRDVGMLLGLDVGRFDGDSSPDDWDGRLERLELDVAGAEGWDSEAQFVRSLDTAVTYVMLDAASGDDRSPLDGASPPQLLTADYHSAHTVMNARPVLGYPPSTGGRFTVDVAGRQVSVDIRPVGDGYIDPTWARRCLDNRVADDHGWYRPSEPDDLATQCYLALRRRPQLTDNDRTMLHELAQRHCQFLGFPPASTISRTQAIEIVDCYLSAQGFVRPVPLDPTVEHHDGPRLERLLRSAHRALFTATGSLTGFIRTRWLAARDALVFRAPALRRLVRRWIRRS